MQPWGHVGQGLSDFSMKICISIKNTKSNKESGKNLL